MFESEIMRLLLCDLLSQIAQRSKINIVRINALCSVLYEAGVPFDTKYTPGSRKQAATVELTISINPTTTMVYSLEFGADQAESTQQKCN